MNYTIAVDDVLWRPIIFLLVAFVLVSAASALAMWRLRRRLGLKGLFLYVAFWAVIVAAVDRYWVNARNHAAGWQSSGLLYDQHVPPDAQDALRRLINSRAFKLECGRNVASKKRLEDLFTRCDRWELSAEEDEVHGSFFPVTAAADGLTLREKLVLDEWFDLWKSEAEHASLVTFLTETENSSVAIDRTTPSWKTSTNGVPVSTSFDFPPQTQYVRNKMRRLAVEHQQAGVREYCLRLLKSAAELDRQVGHEDDPLCDAQAIQRERERRPAEPSE